MNEYAEAYEQEIEQIPALTESEAAGLAGKLPLEQAASELINRSLPYVLECARSYAVSEEETLELLQEGSMAVTLLVRNYREGDFQHMRDIAVHTAMQAYLDAQKDNEKIEDKLTSYINVLNEVTSRMAQEAGREPTVEEIAEKMQMDEDEIRILMKEAVNAVNYNSGADGKQE